MSKMALAYNMKKRMKKECHGGEMAEGGSVDEETTNHVPVTGGIINNHGDARYTVEHKNGTKKHFDAPEGEHHIAKKQADMYRKERLPKKLAEGGEVDHDADFVARIMHKRKMYSEGGEVANDDQPMADAMPNDFDDLALRDGLEFHDTGANSGDELGDHQEDEDRKDIVGKIMKSRSKKDKNPRPA
jgi:hypothetical protein